MLDTRADTATGPSELIGQVERGDILTLPVAGVGDVPSVDVTAVAVDLVSVDADRPGYLSTCG